MNLEKNFDEIKKLFRKKFRFFDKTLLLRKFKFKFRFFDKTFLLRKFKFKIDLIKFILFYL